jgi:hypothetical protein
MIWMNAIVAGFVAALTLAVLVTLKKALGLWPEVDLIAALTDAASPMLGLRWSAALGWFTFFFLKGLVWPSLFAMLADTLPGNRLVQALIVAGIAWAATVAVIVPLSGGDALVLERSTPLLAGAAIAHLIYWTMLGLVFAKLTPPRLERARFSSGPRLHHR